MMTFNELVEQILKEDNVAGGSGSAFGSGVVATETPFSGDTYAPGDARRPVALGGIIRRSGVTGKKTRKKRKKR